MNETNPYRDFYAQQNPSSALLNVEDALDGNPDQHAGYLSLAKQTGLPVAAVADDPERIKKEQEKNQYREAWEKFPKLREAFNDPDVSRLGVDDLVSLMSSASAISLADRRRYAEAAEKPKLFDQLHSGTINMWRASSAVNIVAAAPLLSEFDNIDAMTPEEVTAYHAQKVSEEDGTGSLDQHALMRYILNPGERENIRQTFQTDITKGQSYLKETDEARKTLNRTPESDDFMRLMNSEKPEDKEQAWAVFRSNPFGIIQQIGVESLPQMIPGLALTVATGNPALMGVGSALVENSSSIMEGLEKAGADITTPEGIEKLTDAEFMKPILQKAATRSLIVGGFDSLSGGLASKTLVPAFKSILARHAANMPAQMVTQAAMGGAGEAGAQLATEGKLQWGDIWAEVFGEFVSAPVEVAGASWAVRGERAAARIMAEQTSAQQAISSQEPIDALAEAAGQSLLRERSPEHYEKFVEGMVASSEFETISIPADKFTEYFQSVNIDPFSLVEDDSFSQKVTDALVNGDDVVLPMGTFMARIAPDHYAGLRDHIRTGENAYTPAEAAEIQKHLDQAIEDSAAELLAEMEAEKAARAPGQAIYDNVFEQLRSVGKPINEASQNAALFQARYEARAARLGIDAHTLYTDKQLHITNEQRTNRIDAVPVDNLDLLIDTLRRGEVKTESRGLSLIEFIAKRGGMKDLGQDVAAMDGDIWHKGKAFQKKLVRENGAHPDDVALSAWENGYFPEMNDRPTVDNLLEAIRAEMRGEVRYTREANDNATEELSKVLDQIGLDPKTSTNAEIKAVLQTELFQEGEIDNAARALRVDPDTDVRIHDVTPRFASYEEGHAWLKTHEARDALKGPVTNELTGETIEITASGIAHAVGSNIRSGRKTPARMEAIAAWRELLTHAVPTGPYAAREKDAHMLDAIHNYYAAMHMNGETYLVRMMVRQFKEERSRLDGISVFRVHDTKTSSLPISSDLHSVSQTTNPPGEGSTIKVRDLLKGIKGPDGKELFQGALDPKGSIRFGENETIISLFQKADKSTFLHETGHLFFSDLVEDAFHSEAPTQLQADLATALKWAGVTVDPATMTKEQVQAAITTDVQEQWARGFEAYLREGNAPSVGLQRVFSMFKAWLTRIYKSVKSLGVELSPEIKGVMDRMLATEEQIEETRRAMNYKPLFDNAEKAGLTEEQYTEYVEGGQKAFERAQERVLKRALKEESDRRTKEYKAERDTLKTDIKQEVLVMPLHRAAHFLKTGDYFLDKAALADIVGETNLKEFTGKYRIGGGLHPDFVAEQMGFDSGEQMIKALLGDKRRGQELQAQGDKRSTLQYDIDTLTDQRMIERHGDMLTDGTIEEEALSAVHDAPYGEVLVKELNLLRRLQSKSVSASVTDTKPFRSAAAKMLSRRTVAEARKSETWYRRAEVRAAREAERAVAKGDIAEAIRQKQLQTLNFFLVSEARNVREEIDSVLSRFKKLERKDEKLSKGIDIDYARAAQAVLNQHGLFWDTKFDLVEWLKANAQNEELQAVADYDFSKAKPFKELTLDEFRDLADVVDNIVAVGRNERRMELDGEKVFFDDAAAELSTIINDRTAGKPEIPASPTTTRDSILYKALGLRAHMTRAETFVRGLGAAATRYLYNPVREAETAYSIAKGEVFSKLHDVLLPLKGTLHTRKIAAPELGNFTFNNKGELIHALLHTGNLSNKERLIEGYKWTDQAWTAFTGRMYAEHVITKQDMDAVQGIWDLMDGIKTDLQATHRKMYGYYFNEIEAAPIKTPWGEYRGGYAPAIYDQKKSMKGEEQAKKMAEGKALDKSAFPSTGRSATKNRADHDFQPLRLDLSEIGRHIDWTMKFIHMQPAIRQTARLLKRHDMVKAFHRLDPHAIQGVLAPFLHRAAQQSLNTEEGSPTPGAGFLNVLRTRTGQFIMVGNILNAMQQVTGFSSALALVPGSHLRRASANILKPGVRASILEKSPYMQSRLDDRAQKMGHAVKRDLMKQTIYHKGRAFTDEHGYFFQQVMQNGIDAPVWLASYDHAIQKGFSEKEAVLEADSVVRRTQGSFSPSDSSAIEAGNSLKRLAVMFYSYFNIQGNLFFGEAAKTIRETEGAPVKMSAKLAYLTFVTIYVPAVVAEVIMKGIAGDLDDAEDWLTLATVSPLKMVTAMIPGAGQFINAAASRAWGGKPGFGDRVSVSPAFSTLERAFGALDALQNDSKKTSASIKDAAAALSLATGIPLGQASRMLGFIADVEEGHVQVDDVQDYLFGLLSGRRGKK